MKESFTYYQISSISSSLTLKLKNFTFFLVTTAAPWLVLSPLIPAWEGGVQKQRQLSRWSLSSAYQSTKDHSACPRGTTSVCASCFLKRLLQNMWVLDKDQAADPFRAGRALMPLCHLMPPAPLSLPLQICLVIELQSLKLCPAAKMHWFFGCFFFCILTQIWYKQS